MSISVFKIKDMHISNCLTTIHKKISPPVTPVLMSVDLWVEFVVFYHERLEFNPWCGELFSCMTEIIFTA